MTAGKLQTVFESHLHSVDCKTAFYDFAYTASHEVDLSTPALITTWTGTAGASWWTAFLPHLCCVDKLERRHRVATDDLRACQTGSEVCVERGNKVDSASGRDVSGNAEEE
jgi:hypothetical protein